MRSQKLGSVLAVRVDRGEELLGGLKAACLKHGVKAGVVTGIGATDDFTVGVYDVETRVYRALDYKGPHEIVSLVGNITTKNGEYYAHLHMSAGNETGALVGGHLNRAVISATSEIFITLIDGTVERETDEETGLNLLSL